MTIRTIASSPSWRERWEISPDGLTYTFHLRQDVKWHDGLPFTAADVIATFDKLQDPAVNAASTRADFAELARYAAPDPHRSYCVGSARIFWCSMRWPI